MNLLSVDWDYFFPNPSRTDPIGDDVLLYDWNSVESLFHIQQIWEGRAVGFLRTGKELPMAQGWETFWNRFRFRKRAKLYIAESHSAIAELRLFQQFRGKGIWNFDAHHDGGYHSESIEQIEQTLKAGKVSCENWAWWYIATGTEVQTVYPTWQKEGIEPEPALPMWLSQDTLEPVEEWFGAAFLCRSGAWMPSWTDDQFAEFVSRFPGPVEELQPLVERTFDLTKAERQGKMLDSLLKLAEGA